MRNIERAWQNAQKQRHREAAAAFADAPEHVQQKAEASGSFAALMEEAAALAAMPEEQRPAAVARIARRAHACHLSPTGAAALQKRIAGITGHPIAAIRCEFSTAARGAAGPQDADEETEITLAARFEARHRDTLRFDCTSRRWLLLDPASNVWRPDTLNQHAAMARAVVEEAAQGGADRSTRQRIGRAATVAGVVRLAQAAPGIVTDAERHDTNPAVIGTPGGVYDLRTGRPQPADAARAELVTRTTRVAPADTADCPTWRGFIGGVAQGDAAFIQHIQRVLGYMLWGANPEQVFIFIFGPGGTGKSVLLDVLLDVLGSYGGTAPLDTFTATKMERSPADLAYCAGVRLLAASETPAGREWDEQRVKLGTGGDPVTARAPYGQFFTYTPAFLLLVAGNHKLRLPGGGGEAMRRRIRIWPFTRIPPVRDTTLPDRLKAEAPSVLRWLMDGCVAWWSAREAGDTNALAVPPVVRAASDDYFAQEDTVRLWLDETTETAPDAREAPQAALESYNAWAGRNAAPRLRGPELMARLQALGFTRSTVRGRTAWQGFRLAQGGNPFTEEAA